MATYLENQTLFAECIEAFRNKAASRSYQQETVESILLTPFQVDTQWDLGECKIDSSKRIDHCSDIYGAFISVVSSPPWIDTENRGLYSVALSSVISFVSLKVFKSAEKDLPILDEKIEFDEFLLCRLGFSYPIKISGKGAGGARLSQDRQTALCNEVRDFIECLQAIDVDKYQKIMQSIRLVHLALLNREVDFGLSYLLIVAAIESIAKEAVKRKSKQHLRESEWKQLANENTTIKELYDAYKESRGKNQYLKERYVQFILKYAPPGEWKNYVRHPYQDTVDSIQDVDPNTANEFHRYLTKKNFDERYPEDLGEHEIEKILGDSYRYRSEFVHQGKQPPHNNPSTHNWFFEQGLESFPGRLDKKGSGYIKVTDKHNQSKYPRVIIEERILPKYELLLGIAKHSIIKYTNELPRT